jgi:hypothetical protein
MRLKFATALVAMILAGGCYRITVISNATPSPTVVDKPWQHSFIAGLVPPPEINVKDQCPNGVARVETVHSPANVLAMLLTQGLYSPLAVKVTCAAR